MKRLYKRRKYSWDNPRRTRVDNTRSVSFISFNSGSNEVCAEVLEISQPDSARSGCNQRIVDTSPEFLTKPVDMEPQDPESLDVRWK